MPAVTAVVFDLDGTLIDSAPDLHTAANRLLGERHLPPLRLAQIQAMVGEGVARLVDRVFTAAGASLDEAAVQFATERFRDLYLERPCEATTVLPGAIACLEALAADGIPLALCTNKPIAHTHAILAQLDLARHFGAVVGGDTLPVRKPDPAPLLLALGGIGAVPASGLMVGDSATDLATACAAAVRIALVDGGYSQTPVRAMPADHHLADLMELPPLIAATTTSARTP